jgi:hypothetical protein
MQEVVAVSVGPSAAIDGFRGSVLAVHRRSVYLEPLAAAPLLVVHDASQPHTPTSILVDTTRIGRWPVEPGEVAAGRAGHLRLGRLVVDTRQARRWEMPEPPAAGPVSLELAHRLRSHTDPASCAAATAVAEHLVACPVDAGAVRAALLPLVGTGPGLTPAGDDALVGMLAVLHRLGRPDRAESLLAAVSAALPPLLWRTTPISAHYLHLAIRGVFGQALLAVVDGVADEAGPSPDALGRLLATGATSGADALAGVVAGLAVLAQLPFSSELKDVA